MSKESIHELLKQVYPLSLRMELFNAIWIDLIKEGQQTERALLLAVEELDDAKDMLRECGKNEWASLLNTSSDYFKAKAKEELKCQK